MNHDVAKVNGSNPWMLPGSFLYEKEPGYEAMAQFPGEGLHTVVDYTLKRVSR